MLVFSSAERTNSLAPSLRPFQMRWYKIQNASGLGFEIRISWEDPAAVLPRTDGVLAQPSPDGGVTDGCRQAASADVGAEFGHAPARKGHTEAMGQFAGDGFNAHDQFWGGNPGSAGALSVLQAGQTFFKEPFSPATHDLASRAQAIGNLIVRQALLSEEDHLGASNCKIR